MRTVLLIGLTVGIIGCGADNRVTKPEKTDPVPLKASIKPHGGTAEVASVSKPRKVQPQPKKSI